MELFSEIYSSYYRAVEAVLRAAQQRPLSSAEIQKILSEHSFSESTLTIFPKLQSGAWPLLHKTESGYAAACACLPEAPLSDLQKAWLLAILDDPRMRLFLDDTQIDALRQALLSIQPLYQQQDFHLFDKALDGDAFDCPGYQSRFRAFLTAIREKSALRVQYESAKDSRVNGVFWPLKLEYSQKDDKFRAHCYRKSGNRKLLNTLNLGRVVSAELIPQEPGRSIKEYVHPAHAFGQVVLEITKERNALERSMIQFAHFEKRTEYDEATDTYLCTISYNRMDETELLIRVLSFGPTVRVISPASFIQAIRDRVGRQAGLIAQEGML